MVPHINTHRGTCVYHGGASPRRQQPQRDPEGLVAGTAPATSDRQSHTDNAHHSAHTCAPGTSSHMRTSGICTALSSAHARQTQQMQSSHFCGDLVFILRSPARAHDLGCSKTPEVDCVDLSHAPHKTVAQWNNANGIYTAPRSARDTADGWCSKTPKDGRRELHCSMARGIGTG